MRSSLGGSRGTSRGRPVARDVRWRRTWTWVAGPAPPRGARPSTTARMRGHGGSAAGVPGQRAELRRPRSDADSVSPVLLSKHEEVRAFPPRAHDGAAAPPHGLSMVRPSARSDCRRAKGLESDCALDGITTVARQSRRRATATGGPRAVQGRAGPDGRRPGDPARRAAHPQEEVVSAARDGGAVVTARRPRDGVAVHRFVATTLPPSLTRATRRSASPARAASDR